MFPALISILLVAAGAFAAMIDVKVGSGGLTFDPDVFTASIGDSVVFHFYSGSGSHNVVSGAFDSPCMPNTDAFFSGIIPGTDDGANTFTINVTSNDPIWLYCSVRTHCVSGMAAVINPPADHSIAAYKEAAQLHQGAATDPETVQGGIVAIGSVSSSAVATLASTVVSGNVSSTVTSTSSVASTGSATFSGTRNPGGPAASTTSTPASTNPSVSATSTPNGAGKTSEWSVIMVLGLVLMGTVALMA
ncbi:uncharacterized protein L3040_001436 [Drepanopeziza brunnea f. sp. 'multigermtubi']|uniref:Extracellular serine-rich protein n=1 Tax=Marssonina brunnea f. sp. multigermtubi (strain MB_m1) TaxID=1072389 RepID=K1WGN0_MARBU|nr:extracellular serine-rich protein [Drepanopeziza brunnea f. sp. 'multigermtubi' MB_m1]EKD16695.1 extracellular serine-rich protein [Drepanopeziza brunnea f. sp. 'multigermtubi' MB_m1]KAJ5051661.1 hypothetical protein L3040_001436 [Drepanopeziza brunnea f. sp. 'multigermtubi']